MSKTIKYAISSILVIFLVVGTALIALSYYIDPEVLKTKIISSVKASTGRNMTISGDVDWTVFPNFSIEVAQASLANPAAISSTDPFASIETLKLRVQLLPLLLDRSIILDEIIIHEGRLNFITSATGQNNWDDLLKKPAAANSDVSGADGKKSADDKTPPVSFNIAKLKFKNSILVWDNQQENQHWQVSELNVDGEDLSFDHAFPITISGNISDAATHLDSSWNISAQANVNPAQQLYTLNELKIDATLSGDTIPKGTQQINLSVDEIQFDKTQQWVSLKSLVLNAFGTQATGAIDVKNNQMTGDFKMNQLVIDNIQTTDIDAPITGEKGIYTLNPITGKLYNGNFNGKISIDINNAVPQWNLGLQVSDVQLQNLLKDLYGQDRFTGILQGTGQFTANGTDRATFLSSLNGNTQLQLANGTLEGVDIAYWWQVGNKLLKADPNVLTITDTKRTPIVNMTSSFTFNNGVGTTKDLQLSNSIIFVTGEGQVDLVQRYINLKLYVSQNKNGQPYGQAIPLVMSGNFGSVTVKPDSATITSMATKAISNVTSSKIAKEAGKLTGKAPAELQKPINNALNKLLGK